MLASEIRQQNPRYAEVRYPAPLAARAVQELIDLDSALLEYAVGEEASYLFVVTREALSVYPMPPAGELETRVRSLRELLQERGRGQLGRYTVKASELYQLLVAPAEEVLKHKKRLLIVPDGPLHLVPFEALLTDPEASRNQPLSELPYLLRSHVVSYVPSASVLAQFRAPRPHRAGPGGKSLLAFAPWSSPEDKTHRTAALRASASATATATATTGATELLPALPESGKEVSRIAALYPASDVLVYLDHAASEASVRSNPLLATAHRIHFATHGLISEQQPLLSGLALSPREENQSQQRGQRAQGDQNDGVLRTHEIFDLDLSADLIVLSACETGLGMRLSGEGIVGLTRAFFYAGASSLVVSLWNVADVSTSDLMTAFYRRLPPGADDADKAEALRQAKLELIAAGGQHAHPFHWSPFVLVGDPR